ncbi:hypothetical protein IU501_33045 [Nocardia otitidiscaviarum]|uniref:hypothetical protein n=1 Tax=Nocardia otitidiscaviarum TaxID=1823 RepID=UPI0004A6EB8E|nr:hypothetical protein [Nocardia otitidiscaviarum]MBF6137800.1 hypothetical protein [Nocardia otitidiscaviarum]MBF6485323.1 hypothetical protein [Nocardia otitidiscaviarum]
MNNFQHTLRHDEQHDQSWLAQAHAVVSGGWLAGGTVVALGAVSSDFPVIVSSLMFLAGAVTAEGGVRHYRTYRRVTAELSGCTCRSRDGLGGPARAGGRR